MRRRLLWVFSAGIVLSLVVLMARHDAGTFAIPSLDMSSDDFGALAYNLALLAFVGGALLVVFRDRLSQALEAALFWVAVGLVLALGYTYRAELRSVGDRILAEIVPGRAVSRGVRTVEFARGRSGDFQVATSVNGARVNMVLDTGASAVVLTQQAAKAAGLPLEVLAYDVSVDTANGRTRAAAVTLDRLAVGDIVERSVPALVAQPGQLRISLLGMSFLNRLESWEVRGDKLMVRGYR
jgi:aspartyl protease family protein